MTYKNVLLSTKYSKIVLPEAKRVNDATQLQTNLFIMMFLNEAWPSGKTTLSVFCGVYKVCCSRQRF